MAKKQEQKNKINHNKNNFINPSHYENINEAKNNKTKSNH